MRLVKILLLILIFPLYSCLLTKSTKQNYIKIYKYEYQNNNKNFHKITGSIKLEEKFCFNQINDKARIYSRKEGKEIYIFLKKTNFFWNENYLFFKIGKNKGNKFSGSLVKFSKEELKNLEYLYTTYISKNNNQIETFLHSNNKWINVKVKFKNDTNCGEIMLFDIYILQNPSKTSWKYIDIFVKNLDKIPGELKKEVVNILITKKEFPYRYPYIEKIIFNYSIKLKKLSKLINYLRIERDTKKKLKVLSEIAYIYHNRLNNTEKKIIQLPIKDSILKMIGNSPSKINERNYKSEIKNICQVLYIGNSIGLIENNNEVKKKMYSIFEKIIDNFDVFYDGISNSCLKESFKVLNLNKDILNYLLKFKNAMTTYNIKPIISFLVLSKNKKFNEKLISRFDDIEELKKIKDNSTTKELNILIKVLLEHKPYFYNTLRDINIIETPKLPSIITIKNMKDAKNLKNLVRKLKNNWSFYYIKKYGKIEIYPKDYWMKNKNKKFLYIDIIIDNQIITQIRIYPENCNTDKDIKSYTIKENIGLFIEIPATIYIRSKKTECKFDNIVIKNVTNTIKQIYKNFPSNNVQYVKYEEIIYLKSNITTFLINTILFRLPLIGKKLESFYTHLDCQKGLKNCIDICITKTSIDKSKYISCINYCNNAFSACQNKEINTVKYFVCSAINTYKQVLSREYCQKNFFEVTYKELKSIK